MAEAYRF